MTCDWLKKWRELNFAISAVQNAKLALGPRRLWGKRRFCNKVSGFRDQIGKKGRMEWQELQVGVRELHLRKLHKLKQKLHPCVADFASFEAGLDAWRDLSQELMESVF